MGSETANYVVIERNASGKPNGGKVLVAVGANITDIPISAGGTCAKFMNEGYEGYLVRISNDELQGEGSVFQNIHNNETEAMKAAKALGFRETLNLYYQNHNTHGRPLTDLVVRLVFIFRMLKADTVITLKSSGGEDISPEKEITFNAVRQAVLLAGNKNYYPEHLDAGVTAHSAGQLYFAVHSNDPSCNRIVDISAVVERKIDAVLECSTQGVGKKGAILRAKLASEGRQLPILGNDDRTANRAYIRHFTLEADKRVGEENGLGFAETFCCVDRKKSDEARKLEVYIEKNAIQL